MLGALWAARLTLVIDGIQKLKAMHHLHVKGNEDGGNESGRQ